MAEAWSMVRVRQATLAALGRLIDSRDESAARGQMSRWWRGEQGPTYDEMIAWLVRHATRKHERSKQSRRRTTGRACQPETPDKLSEDELLAILE